MELISNKRVIQHHWRITDSPSRVSSFNKCSNKTTWPCLSWGTCAGKNNLSWANGQTVNSSNKASIALNECCKRDADVKPNAQDICIWTEIALLSFSLCNLKTKCAISQEFSRKQIDNNKGFIQSDLEQTSQSMRFPIIQGHCVWNNKDAGVLVNDCVALSH